MVDDLDSPSNNALGCAGGTSNGKFTIRGGSPSGGGGEYPQIDLHQLGAGYQGHMWFTHVYAPNDPNADAYGQVAGDGRLMPSPAAVADGLGRLGPARGRPHPITPHAGLRPGERCTVFCTA
jgi:hypothetical protein